MKNNTNYNPTCAITGRTEDLQMFPHRDEEGGMIGWFFLHKDQNPEHLKVDVSVMAGETEDAIQLIQLKNAT